MRGRRRRGQPACRRLASAHLQYGCIPRSLISSPLLCPAPLAWHSTYLVAGFFGAATYGDQTSSNVLENEWLPGVGTVVLNFLVSFYLLISVPPIVFANVYTSEHFRTWPAPAACRCPRSPPRLPHVSPLSSPPPPWRAVRNWVTLASRGKLDKYPDWVRRLIS